MTVNICGIPHKVVECDSKFDVDLHMGEIRYADAEIRINKALSENVKTETLCHEIMHGILVHLGYNDLSQDEQFIQAVANAINQAFTVKIGTDTDCGWWRCE